MNSTAELGLGETLNLLHFTVTAMWMKADKAMITLSSSFQDYNLKHYATNRWRIPPDILKNLIYFWWVVLFWFVVVGWYFYNNEYST